MIDKGFEFGFEELDDTSGERVTFRETIKDVAALADAFDDALAFETDQRFADSGAADTDLFGNVRWRVFTAGDELAEDTNRRHGPKDLVERVLGQRGRRGHAVNRYRGATERTVVC